MTQKARPLRDGDRDKGQRQGLQEAHIIPPELAVAINAEHQAAFGKAREALEHARRAGELLLQAKAAVEHGDWAMWLTENISFSDRTAQTYMQVARNWVAIQAKSAAAADFTLRQALIEICDKRHGGRGKTEASLAQVSEGLKTTDTGVASFDRIHDAVGVDDHDRGVVEDHHQHGLDGVDHRGVQVQVYMCLLDAWDEADTHTRRDFLLDDDVKAELLKLCRHAEAVA